MNHDGQMYLAPANDNENRISGLRSWEQGFWVYATIYSRANRTRSAEIWQYLHIINTAAANYSWDNMAYYDFTFHQMMGQNPLRSWAKTYNQLWTLSMCNPIQRFQGPSSHKKKQGQGRKSNRPCWKFNRNQPCSPSCDFDHKCSYCGGFGHSVIDCDKLAAVKRKDKGDRSDHQGYQGRGHGSNAKHNNHNNNHSK